MMGGLMRSQQAASVSRRCCSSSAPLALNVPRRQLQQRLAPSNLSSGHRRPFAVRVAVDEAPDWEEQAEDQEGASAVASASLWDREEYMWDNSYAVNNKYNQEPDFSDPEWYKSVTVSGHALGFMAASAGPHTDPAR
jgi:hypothetical protein